MDPTSSAKIWVVGLEAEGAEEGHQLLLLVRLRPRHPDVHLLARAPPLAELISGTAARCTLLISESI